MINNLLTFLNYENIYLIANWGVIPFWLLLLFIPHNQLTNFFVQSIIAPLLLGIGYAYLSYLIYLECSYSLINFKSNQYLSSNDLLVIKVKRVSLTDLQ